MDCKKLQSPKWIAIFLQSLSIACAIEIAIHFDYISNPDCNPIRSKNAQIGRDITTYLRTRTCLCLQTAVYKLWGEEKIADCKRKIVFLQYISNGNIDWYLFFPLNMESVEYCDRWQMDCNTSNVFCNLLQYRLQKRLQHFCNRLQHLSKDCNY